MKCPNSLFNTLDCDRPPRTLAAIMPGMVNPSRSPLQRRNKTAHDLLIKGVMIAAIGLGVLLAPYFMAATELRAVLLESYLVGWFALLLGSVLTTQYVVRRLKQR